MHPLAFLLAGGQLRSYQMKGLCWLVGLHQRGLNGILAGAHAALAPLQRYIKAQATLWLSHEKCRSGRGRIAALTCSCMPSSPPLR